LGRVKSIKASDFFIRAGETPIKIAYVFKGLFRYVYLNDKGDEFTKGIISENFFISSYSAMILDKPSYFSIESLEDSEILEISWKDFMQLLDQDIFWVKFLLKFIERGYMIKEKRERDLLLLDAETRYKDFLIEFSRNGSKNKARNNCFLPRNKTGNIKPNQKKNHFLT
jgi:CRP-like cAMP-binding protein